MIRSLRLLRSLKGKEDFIKNGNWVLFLTLWNKKDCTISTARAIFLKKLLYIFDFFFYNKGKYVYLNFKI